MRTMQMATGMAVAVIFAINGCGGANPAGGGPQNNAAGGTCAQKYTTEQLTGCFQSDTASGAVMNYYCFDGGGGYRNDVWMAMTGCSTQHTGQYVLNGCTLEVCDDTGCSQYNFKADESGVLLDGEHYTSGSGCN